MHHTRSTHTGGYGSALNLGRPSKALSTASVELGSFAQNRGRVRLAPVLMLHLQSAR